MEIAGAAGDLWEFEDFARSNPALTPLKVPRYEYILELYQGELFADDDYLWSIPKRAEMLGFYVMLSKRLCSYFIAEGRLEEAMHRVHLLMGIYFRQKDRISLIRHYHAMKEMLNYELGLEPKESVRQLYSEMLDRQ